MRDYAKQYVEQLREQQRKAQEAKEQEERRKEESEKTARSLLEQLDKLISVAEEAAEKARSNAEPLQEGHELNDTEVWRMSWDPKAGVSGELTALGGEQIGHALRACTRGIRSMHAVGAHARCKITHLGSTLRGTAVGTAKSGRVPWGSSSDCV